MAAQKTSMIVSKYAPICMAVKWHFFDEDVNDDADEEADEEEEEEINEMATALDVDVIFCRHRIQDKIRSSSPFGNRETRARIKSGSSVVFAGSVVSIVVIIVVISILVGIDVIVVAFIANVVFVVFVFVFVLFLFSFLSLSWFCSCFCFFYFISHDITTKFRALILNSRFILQNFDGLCKNNVETTKCYCHGLQLAVSSFTSHEKLD